MKAGLPLAHFLKYEGKISGKTHCLECAVLLKRPSMKIHQGLLLTKRITRQLDVLDAATSIQAFNVPGYRLHLLKGQRAGEWAIWVTGNWRITFRLDRGDIYDVNSEDYH